MDNVCVHRKGSGNYKIKVLETGWPISTRFPGKLATVRPFPAEIRKVEHIYGTVGINLKRANVTRYFCLQNIVTAPLIATEVDYFLCFRCIFVTFRVPTRTRKPVILCEGIFQSGNAAPTRNLREKDTNLPFEPSATVVAEKVMYLLPV